MVLFIYISELLRLVQCVQLLVLLQRLFCSCMFCMCQVRLVCWQWLVLLLQLRFQLRLFWFGVEWFQIICLLQCWLLLWVMLMFSRLLMLKGIISCISVLQLLLLRFLFSVRQKLLWLLIGWLQERLVRCVWLLLWVWMLKQLVLMVFCLLKVRLVVVWLVCWFNWYLLFRVLRLLQLVLCLMCCRLRLSCCEQQEQLSRYCWLLLFWLLLLLVVRLRVLKVVMVMLLLMLSRCRLLVVLVWVERVRWLLMLQWQMLLVVLLVQEKLCRLQLLCRCLMDRLKLFRLCVSRVLDMQNGRLVIICWFWVLVVIIVVLLVLLMYGMLLMVKGLGCRLVLLVLQLLMNRLMVLGMVVWLLKCSSGQVIRFGCMLKLWVK